MHKTESMSLRLKNLSSNFILFNARNENNEPVNESESDINRKDICTRKKIAQNWTPNLNSQFFCDLQTGSELRLLYGWLC
ncbi:CLUMA_CG004958, isoform A [Clunio marinus]|uniref:CLUMA_CG004958, isoform A n=1 Tax=Clunio marinus TaxID=568069 RepID=A0A1J1HT94_9DIPT|nr:CLUMA_CG004958, isoform A [Clunio marinus]